MTCTCELKATQNPKYINKLHLNLYCKYNTILSLLNQSMEENQNGMPPSQDRVDFKTLALKPGVIPFNRLAPLTSPSNVHDQHSVTVKPTDYGAQQPIPELGQGGALPPVKVDGLYE